jgi:hypothetical protein
MLLMITHYELALHQIILNTIKSGNESFSL